MLTVIEEMFKDILKPKDQFVLIEKSIGMTKKVIKCHNSPHLLYRLDHESISDLFPLFKNVRCLKKMCDYALFLDHGDKLYIFLIEMKQGQKCKTKQLDAAETFLKFVIESAKRLKYPTHPFLDDKNIIIRKVGITGNNTKGCTKRKAAKCEALSSTCYPKTPYIACAGGSQLMLKELVEAV